MWNSILASEGEIKKFIEGDEGGRVKIPNRSKFDNSISGLSQLNEIDKEKELDSNSNVSIIQ